MAKAPSRAGTYPRSTPASAGQDASETRYRAPALDKGLDILELLSEQPQGLTRGEIVKAMGRGPSEIYRMLERLVARHYVSRSAEGDRYALSLKLFVLAQRHPPLNRLVARATPVMDAFAKASEQSCHLGVYDRGNVSIVAQVASPGQWGLSIRLGARVSLVDTGSGHVLLAYQTPQRRTEMLAAHEALDGEVPLSERALAAVFSKLRQQGWWQGDSLQAQGVVDVSVPVLGPGGEALAVLTCPYMRRIDRHVGPSVDEVRGLLLGAAEALGLR